MKLHLAVLALACGAVAFAQDPPVKGAIPYTLSFERQPPARLPSLQAYSVAAFDDGTWFIVGGRSLQGLHGVNATGDFPQRNQNQFLWSVNPPTNTAIRVIDLKTLDPS
ncbi:MAG TPA: hypothetical protein VLT57_10295, partial [Bryobacteraceae bacterium]|nr:hypothetical protein [Bryobacteraceae bacterium]